MDACQAIQYERNRIVNQSFQLNDLLYSFDVNWSASAQFRLVQDGESLKAANLRPFVPLNSSTTAKA